MYKPGDDKLEVRELLVKAFASAWEAGDKAVDRDTYINSSINVIDSLQVGPEMIYGEEGQGLLDEDEAQGAGRVLKAAAMTYVAALLTSLLQLLRFLLIFLGRGGGSDRRGGRR